MAQTYWIARDKDGILYLWKEKPTRVNERGWFNTEKGHLGQVGDLNPSDFPEITWKNSPVKCKIMLDKDND